MENKKTPKAIPTTFQGWVKQTFTWVDNDVKRYMQRAWAASTKARNELDKQEVKALKKQNEEYRAMLAKILNLDIKEDYYKMHIVEPVTELLTKYNK